MKGLAEILDIAGRGTLQWLVKDDAGQETSIEMEAYYVPCMTMHLLSPQAYFKQLHQGHAIVCPCCNINNNRLTVPCASPHNLPIVQATQEKEQTQTIMASATWVLDEQNQNLRLAQKELLKWHFHLSHLAFDWLQQLASKPSNIRLPSKIANCECPLCVACQFGKAKQ